MTKKRFENRLNKKNIKFNTQNPVWDNIKEDAFNVFEMIDMLNNLSEENEQLKSTIKDVIKLLSEEVDLFSDKALEHDICAYIELQELDNKDAYYMATSTKKAIKMLKELKND